MLPCPKWAVERALKISGHLEKFRFARKQLPKILKARGIAKDPAEARELSWEYALRSNPEWSESVERFAREWGVYVDRT